MPILGSDAPLRTERRISGRWRVRDQTERIQAGARRVCEYLATRPHSELLLTDEAQKLLLGSWRRTSAPCCHIFLARHFHGGVDDILLFVRNQNVYAPFRKSPPGHPPSHALLRFPMSIFKWGNQFLLGLGPTVLLFLNAGNQVAQSVRATSKDGQSSMEALHANAAHQQGMLSAAVSILELAAGSGSFDEGGNLQVTQHHVEAGCSSLLQLYKLARPLVASLLAMCSTIFSFHSNIHQLLFFHLTGQLVGWGCSQYPSVVSTQVVMCSCTLFDSADFQLLRQRICRWPRGWLSSACRSVRSCVAQQTLPCRQDSDGEQFKPVAVPAPPQSSAAPPAPTQPPQPEEREEEHVPVSVPEPGLRAPQEPARDGQNRPKPKPLRYTDVEPAAVFFAKGLGENDSMILPGQLQDRLLLHKLLLLGRCEVTLPKAVDVYHVLETKDGKRRKIRPPQSKVLQVLQRAFVLYPRLGHVQLSTGRGSETTVSLCGWSSTENNQILYHNEAMQCCRVCIREISKRRALRHNKQGAQQPGAADLPEHGDAAADSVAALPQPATPPTGHA